MNSHESLIVCGGPVRAAYKLAYVSSFIRLISNILNVKLIFKYLIFTLKVGVVHRVVSGYLRGKNLKDINTQ